MDIETPFEMNAQLAKGGKPGMRTLYNPAMLAEAVAFCRCHGVRFVAECRACANANDTERSHIPCRHGSVSCSKTSQVAIVARLESLPDWPLVLRIV